MYSDIRSRGYFLGKNGEVKYPPARMDFSLFCELREYILRFPETFLNK